MSLASKLLLLQLTKDATATKKMTGGGQGGGRKVGGASLISGFTNVFNICMVTLNDIQLSARLCGGDGAEGVVGVL